MALARRWRMRRLIEAGTESVEVARRQRRPSVDIHRAVGPVGHPGHPAAAGRDELDRDRLRRSGGGTIGDERGPELVEARPYAALRHLQLEAVGPGPANDPRTRRDHL